MVQSGTDEKLGLKELVAMGVGGWLLVVGYIGTMALYSYTFGVYGTAMFGENIHGNAMRHFLQSMILLIFLGINLYGIKAAWKE